ncbi:MAG TPA: hypothetical protein VL069_06195 [Opitutus sp.]|nr:hypothetical protein [Opitutus sp.]
MAAATQVISPAHVQPFGLHRRLYSRHTCAGVADGCCVITLH